MSKMSNLKWLKEGNIERVKNGILYEMHPL
nr:MAG TPA: hypothetical protein [Caudoviricetes sp.]